VGLLPVPICLLVLVAPVLLPIQVADRKAAVGASLILGLVCAYATAAIAISRIVCPSCSKRIGSVFRFDSFAFIRGIPKAVTHCPKCGAQFDSELNKGNSEHAGAGDGQTRA
jgi:hypothetical protein